MKFLSGAAVPKHEAVTYWQQLVLQLCWIQIGQALSDHQITSSGGCVSFYK